MKVAIASFLFDVAIGGGAAVVARRIADDLLAEGSEVVVLTTHARQAAAREQRAGLTIYRLPPSNLYWVGAKDGQPSWKKALWQMLDCWNPLMYAAARQILQRERPTLLHVHKLRGLSPAVWQAASAAGTGRVVHTCHDYELVSPEGTLSGRVGGWAARGFWPLRPYQRLRAASSRSVHAATSPSRHTLDLHSRFGFFERAVKQVIRNSHGMSLRELAAIEQTAAGRPSCQQGPLRLLYLGRLEATKGVDLLCAAFERAAGGSSRLFLDVAGWGSLEQPLRKRYAQHPQIAFHGAVSGSGKAQLLANCDVVAVPSVYQEISPVVVSEAYAYGKPVLAAASGGLPELVEAQHTGWLVRSGDEHSLAELLAELAAEPATARRTAPACFAAARRFSLEAIRQEYSTLYAALAG